MIATMSHFFVRQLIPLHCADTLIMPLTLLYGLLIYLRRRHIFATAGLHFTAILRYALR
jgi:hypothetical protein